MLDTYNKWKPGTSIKLKYSQLDAYLKAMIEAETAKGTEAGTDLTSQEGRAKAKMVIVNRRLKARGIDKPTVKQVAEEYRNVSR